MRRRLTTRWAYMMGAVMGILLVVGHGTAIAQEDDEEDTFEQKIIKGILGGIGLDVGQPGIDYGERAPLVIPPNNDLPPPQASNVATPADWPKEAHHKKPTSTKKLDANGSVRQYATEKATGSAAEMSSGSKPTTGATSVAPRDPADNTTDIGGRPLLSLGDSTGLFNFLGNKPEEAQFVHEPPRLNLTQPPVGYQTPSPNYPYGIAQVKKGPSTLDMSQTKDRTAADPSSGSK